MFARLRGWFEAWKKNLFDAYDPPKPTNYVLGKQLLITIVCGNFGKKQSRTDTQSRLVFL